MTVKALAGFEHFTTHHCVTGSMRHVYAHNGHDVSEDLMLDPPIRNIGVAGIRKAAGLVPRWPEQLDAREVRWALSNTYIFVSPEGGSGGGNFRYMFGRFLAEAAEVTGTAELGESAEEFRQVGDRWEAFGEWCRVVSEADDAAVRLDDAGAQLAALAKVEEAAWHRLASLLR